MVRAPTRRLLCIGQKEIEELGFDSYWVGDHPVEFPFDCFTRLSAIAAITERIRLGTLVACARYRHPLMLARQTADIDRLSGGRLVLGLGIGDAPREFAKLGLPYGTVRERQDVMEELLQVLPALWSGQRVTFEGKHVRLSEAGIYPGPLQQSWVPIMVAGGGERVTLRQVARYADASNTGPGNLIGNARRRQLRGAVSCGGRLRDPRSLRHTPREGSQMTDAATTDRADLRAAGEGDGRVGDDGCAPADPSSSSPR